MRRKKILIPIMGFAALASAAAASAAGMAPPDASEKMARQYENFATRTLARYYEERTFLVKAMIQTEAPAAEPASELDLGGTGEAPQQLPGLPFLPESAEPPQAPAKGDASAEPRAVTLDVLVDTSYSEKDLEFIRSLLTMASHMDEARGDNVKVHEGVFPRDNRALQDYRKPTEAPLLPPFKAADKAGDSAAAKTAGAQRPDQPAAGKDKDKDKAENPFSPYLNHLPSLIPMLIICLLILACVWMVSRAIASHRKEKPDMAVMPPAPPGHEAAPSRRAEEPATPDWAAARGGQVSAAGQAPEFAALRPYMLNCFVGSPKYCGQIIKSWINREAEKGLRDAASVVNSLDPRLMGVLGPELGREFTQRLEGHLHLGEPPQAEELLSIYKEFKREFENLNGNRGEDQYKDLFGFLHQINEQQVMHILRDESAGIAGLVLAQLPPEVAGAVLQKVDPENRAKLLISMGNIDNIPLNVYKEIANRLSLKALDVSNMRYVAADGVDSILELIDNLPLNLQYNYIRSISEMDLGLAEKIRNRYVTLPEVAGLPDRFLAGIVQNVDSETLVLALLHAEDAIRNKIYALLPERMQMMVASGIEGAQAATPKESEAAQRRILHRIRDEIRFSGRPA